MELPHLGTHCHFAECNRLDFLPMKCRGCSESFCSEHFGLDIHNCSKAGIVDRQVPTCPLCNKPVPIGTQNKPLDQLVNDHIDRNCDSEAAAKKRAKKKEGRCCAKKCKTKELIPVFCELCKRSVCLKHRFPKDHDCLHNKNNGLSDQEAMEKAIKLSMQEQPGSTTKLEEARRAQQEALDKAIAQRLQRYETQRQRRSQQQATSSRNDSSSSSSRDCSIQ
ncbi:Oidioi.mRNA.OKI2018_I69.XSR.g13392.t1.cds [Oikopleura dioica]|uniref:Oidioi.mRNA.OKI2018_I69.XSR.g13392.t1.cds n=1 Tax=Oikopleura dioica TaxID=34765 RepID=A0ABN7S6Q8_OIKDI|nr:Oidioi.mRNA.OKI2018_I69.XSR.g13392.t1.cds [Oikopleura dioica]